MATICCSSRGVRRSWRREHLGCDCGLQAITLLFFRPCNRMSRVFRLEAQEPAVTDSGSGSTPSTGERRDRRGRADASSRLLIGGGVPTGIAAMEVRSDYFSWFAHRPPLATTTVAGDLGP